MNLKLSPPKQYKQGWSEFYKLKFSLTQDVLIPRPETEILVTEVTREAKNLWQLHQSGLKSIQNPNFVTILDVGTGSGCIAISIAKNVPYSKLIAIDISQAALEIAQKNSKFHRCDNQIFFFKNDLLDNFSTPPDIIVANLPYIPTARLMLIDPLVSEFEPKIALDGGKDGFDLYRKLFKQISFQFLTPKYLLCEIDEIQTELALSEAKIHFPHAKHEILKDLYKKDRILKLSF